MGSVLRRALFAGVIFWSALLLLLVQPVITKAILPWFGGSAGVWTTSMLFFQMVLLLGYLYAHLLNRVLPLRQQVAVHIALIALSVAFLPLQPSPEWKPAGRDDPSLKILALLGTTLGLPYFLLATTSPLLQSWYVHRFHAQVPYRLFAVSNLGSLVALLFYPFLLEPALTVRTQLDLWSAGFIGFGVLCAAAAVTSWRKAAAAEPGELPARSDILLWFGLAAIPSVLWLAVGNQLSQEIAAVPFLWVMPLAIYLLTFVLCFDSDRWYQPKIFRWILPLAWAGFVMIMAQRGFLQIRTAVPVLFTALFLCCMFCHGELARLRPHARALTSFYLTIAAGGAFGGLVVGVIAPNIFTDLYELPMGVLASIVLALWLLYGLSPKRVLRIAAVVGVAMVTAIALPSDSEGREVSLRNFYGALQIREFGQNETRYRALFNGTIQHGLQFLAPERSQIPTTYYGPASGAAIALKVLQRRGPVHVGVIGLGVGTMAAYGRKEDRYRFYELNPAVVRLAIDDFRYLRETPADVTVVTGDARLSLDREQPQAFDLLALDAFSGDSIPVHLLTREAFALYFQHLAPRGAIAVHVTNKHLELSPVVKMLAEAYGATATLIHNSSDHDKGINMSSWVIVTRNEDLTREISWLGSPVPEKPNLRLWTDDYSNLLTILR